MKITLDEHKTPTKNSHTILQRSPTLHNTLCKTRETGKTTLDNMVENPPGIRISSRTNGNNGRFNRNIRKNQDSKGRISQDWFCIKLYIIYLTRFI